MNTKSPFEKKNIKIGPAEHIIYSLKDDNVSNFALFHIKDTFHAYKNAISELHANDFYSIFFVISGEGTYTVDFDNINIKDGIIIFVSPKHLHGFNGLRINESITIAFTEEFLLHLKSEEAERLRQTLFYGEKGVVSCNIDDVLKEKLLELTELMRNECVQGKKKKSHDFYLANLLALFLYELERKAKWKRTTPGDLNDLSYDLYIRFRKEIEDNYKTCHKVVDYTSKLNVSIAKLNSSIQKYSSATPLQMIIDRIILEAKRMLRYSSFTIKEIYTDLGFEDSSNFSKFFKHNVGIAPQQFRAENKK